MNDLFEVEPGPYEPSADKDFSWWSPEEDSIKVVEYLNKLYDLAKK